MEIRRVARCKASNVGMIIELYSLISLVTFSIDISCLGEDSDAFLSETSTPAEHSLTLQKCGVEDDVLDELLDEANSAAAPRQADPAVIVLFCRIKGAIAVRNITCCSMN